MGWNLDHEAKPVMSDAPPRTGDPLNGQWMRTVRDFNEPGFKLLGDTLAHLRTKSAGESFETRCTGHIVL